MFLAQSGEQVPFLANLRSSAQKVTIFLNLIKKQRERTHKYLDTFHASIQHVAYRGLDPVSGRGFFHQLVLPDLRSLVSGMTTSSKSNQTKVI